MAKPKDPLFGKQVADEIIPKLPKKPMIANPTFEQKRRQLMQEGKAKRKQYQSKKGY